MSDTLVRKLPHSCKGAFLEGVPCNGFLSYLCIGSLLSSDVILMTKDRKQAIPNMHLHSLSS